MKLAIAICLLAAGVGCQRQPPVIADRFMEPKDVILEVGIDYAGASAREVKQLIATPLAFQLSAVSEARGITTHCKTGGYRVYIESRTANPASLADRIQKDLRTVDLPAEASEPRVKQVDAVPRIQASCRARVVVSLDYERLAMYGLTTAQVRSQIPKDALTGTDDSDEVGQIPIKTANGATVRLEDVAALYVTCGAPDVIVDTLELQ